MVGSGSSSGTTGAALPNNAYSLFVVHNFLKINNSFPAWYHEQLMRNLADLYCPLNWGLLQDAERADYRRMAEDVAAATAQGRTLRAFLKLPEEGEQDGQHQPILALADLDVTTTGPMDDGDGGAQLARVKVEPPAMDDTEEENAQEHAKELDAGGEKDD